MLGSSAKMAELFGRKPWDALAWGRVHKGSNANRRSLTMNRTVPAALLASIAGAMIVSLLLVGASTSLIA